jgi:hypothetical protein
MTTNRSRFTRITLTVAVLALLFAAASAASAAVILGNFDGKPAPPDAVHLAWVTDAEEGNAGFHIWRQTEVGNGAAVAFVASAAPPSGLGASYTYTDAVPGPGLYTYWLVSQDEKGNLTPHDAIQVLVEGPTAVELSSLDAGSGLQCRVNKGACECYIRNLSGTGLGWKVRPTLWCRLAGL